MKYQRMAMEEESPEQLGYNTIRNNLTESSVRDRSLGELGVTIDDMLLPYGDHLGKPELREAIAADVGPPLSAGQVLITAGAATALFIVATSLLEKGEHMVVARPNYATNISTPETIGADISYLDLDFEEGFALDIERLNSMVRPETQYISLTYPHNPTGTMLSREKLEAIVGIAESQGCYLLFDETYRELTCGTPLPVAASLSDRVISVSSMSKSFGIPGIRIGWLMTANPELFNTFLAAKEQIGIASSVLDEEIAYQAFARRGSLLPAIRDYNRQALDRVRDWMQKEPRMEWVEPEGGVVCFPGIREGLGISVDRFYRELNTTHGTYVGPGHWFSMPRRFMRVGYAWPTPEELGRGLESISRSLDAATP
ncbi:MAG: aminotransferase class I/II-fold pyridoxal phosphate-dependent enzyme [Synergistales bacterium]|nr:aminotransferase class I/II-fold pyridoxal phosphate-dependent enzyme [Synergistales bacterium]